jgi:hypothetical protein
LTEGLGVDLGEDSGEVLGADLGSIGAREGIALASLFISSNAFIF